jgi:hypothetical protein
MTEAMSGTISYGGGWGTSYEQMSPSLRARCAVADAAYARQAAAEERARAEIAAVDEETRIRASIEMAIDRGEIFDVRQAYRDGGVGRTRAETVAWASAQSDWQDAREARLTAKQVENLVNESLYGDTSAPSPAEVAEQEQTAARAEQYRARRHERGETIKAARRLAAWDRGAR